MLRYRIIPRGTNGAAAGPGRNSNRTRRVGAQS